MVESSYTFRDRKWAHIIFSSFLYEWYVVEKKKIMTVINIHFDGFHFYFLRFLAYARIK